MSAAMLRDRPTLARFADDPHWDRAVLAGACPTPFQTAAWYDSWLETAGAQAKVTPLLFRLPASGPIRLGLAMQLEPGACGGMRLAPLSAPWSDYQDAVGEGATSADLDAAAAWLRMTAATYCARLCCEDVVSGGLLARILARLPGRFAPSSPLVAVDLADSARIAALASRQEYAIKRRRLERKGALSLVHHRHPDDIAQVFPHFVTRHLRQWAGRDDAVAPFSEAGVLEAFEAIARSCAEAGWLLLSELRYGGDTIASYLGFNIGTGYFGYRTCFEQALYAFSPGHILLQDMLRDFAQQGLTRFDLMRGGYAYKSAYGSAFGHNLAWTAARA